MTIKIQKPLWCGGTDNGVHLPTCCSCGRRTRAYYQEGDGKKLHTICRECYHRVKDK